MNSFVDTRYISGERRDWQTAAKCIYDTFFALRPMGADALARAGSIDQILFPLPGR
jgi:hypothetical protein